MAVASSLGAQLVSFVPEIAAAQLKIEIADERLPSHTKSGNKRLVSSLSASSVPELGAFIEKALAHPSVRHAEPHYFGQAALTPDDEYFSQQYYITGTNLNQVWDVETGGSEVTIAILDGGVDYGHPEFAGKIHPGGRDFIDPPQGGDGRATPGDGEDQDGDGIPDNGAFHGSRVAGVALAIGNNGEGIAGANWGARVLSLRIDSAIGEPTGWLVIDCVRAMVYTLKLPEVRILNISAVYPKSSLLLKEATDVCTEYGKIVVAAAGNQAFDTPSLCAPAFFDSSIAVGGTDGLNKIWDDGETGSNYGTFVDILAPAKLIFTVNSNGSQRNYGASNGTSFAAPLISGIAALILTKNPSYTVDDVRAALTVGAKSLDAVHPDKAGKMGAGLVNALTAFSASAQNGLSITAARPQGANYVDLFFNRKLQPESACDVSRYEIEADKYVFAAVLMDDGRRVRLETETLSINSTYEVTASGLLAADGEAMFPAEQSIEFTAKAGLFDLARSSNGSTAYSKTHFDVPYSPDRAIDGFSGTFWFAEVPQGEFVDFVVTLPKVEFVNRIQIEGRTAGISEPPYASRFELYSAGVYNDIFPLLDSEFIEIENAESLPGGIGTIDGKSTTTVEFSAMPAKHIVVRFLSGTDNMLDGDGVANGVSISKIVITRTQAEGDVFAPVIRTMTPASAPLGALVQFTGNHFGQSAPPSIVFGGIDAVVLFWSDTAISALVPYNPLSLPVEFPPVFPPDPALEGETGSSAEIPPVLDAIIPPSQDAESGYVYARRGGFVSNKLFFEVVN